MSIVDGGPGTAGLVSRVQNILLRPQEEWQRIDAEPATVQSLFMGYAVPLAAIPAVCGLVGQFLVLHNIMAAAVFAILGYVLGLAGVFLFGFIIDALAPSFGSTKNQVQAMKAAVYSGTATWVGGVFLLIPIVGGILALIAALYGLYLLFVGLPIMMKTPADKAVVYVIVAIVCDAVIYMIIGGIVGAIVGSIVASALMAAGAAAALH
jgi:hypothetical protein